MKPRKDNIVQNECNPLDQFPENSDESALITVLEILVASGKVSKQDIMAAYSLVV